MHYAIHGKTAAEMINDRVDANKPFFVQGAAGNA